MIVRFVKMTFREDAKAAFKEIFEQAGPLIRKMDGCRAVELLQDVDNPCVFFTRSIWDSPDHLEQYRRSELFLTTWAKTKALFADKAQAWTLAYASV